MAKLERTPDQLVVSENPVVWRGVLLTVGVAMGVGVIAAFWEDPRPADKIVGWTLASLLCLLGAAVSERTRFVFDLGRQTLFRERRRLFGTRSGEMPFADVTDIVLTTHGDTEGTSYGVALVTKTGRIPLSNSLDAIRKNQEELAETILEALSRSTANLIGNSVAQLAKAGDTIAAVTLAKEHYGLDTTRAHKRVEAQKRGADKTR